MELSKRLGLLQIKGQEDLQGVTHPENGIRGEFLHLAVLSRKERFLDVFPLKLAGLLRIQWPVRTLTAAAGQGQEDGPAGIDRVDPELMLAGIRQGGLKPALVRAVRLQGHGDRFTVVNNQHGCTLDIEIPLPVENRQHVQVTASLQPASPGTGRGQVLHRALKHLVAQGLGVAILAQSHVDQAAGPETAFHGNAPGAHPFRQLVHQQADFLVEPVGPGHLGQNGKSGVTELATIVEQIEETAGLNPGRPDSRIVVSRRGQGMQGKKAGIEVHILVNQDLLQVLTSIESETIKTVFREGGKGFEAPEHQRGQPGIRFMTGGPGPAAIGSIPFQLLQQGQPGILIGAGR